LVLNDLIGLNREVFVLHSLQGFYLHYKLFCCIYFITFLLYTHSEFDLSEQLINPEEPDPIYDLYAVTVSTVYNLVHFCKYRIVQNSGRENFDKLVISKFWQGKLWQMLNTGKSEGELSFVNLLKWFMFDDALTHNR